MQKSFESLPTARELKIPFLGILVIEEVDESGKWIDNARKAANELRNSQKPHLIIALLKSGAIQVSVQQVNARVNFKFCDHFARTLE